MISFLADYLGFGNLPEKIAGVIKKLQGWVESILDRVIGWLFEQAKRLFAAVKEAAGDFVAWWKKKSPFKADNGEDHTLYVEGQGAGAKVMVASENPSPLLAFVEAIDTEIGEEKERAKKRTAKTEAKAAAKIIDGVLAKPKPAPGGPAPTPAEQEKQKAEEKSFAAAWKTVLAALPHLFGDKGDLLVGKAPKEPEYGPRSSGGGYGTSMEVRLLRGKLDNGLLAGTPPSDSTKSENHHFRRLCKRLAGVNTCYRAGHLLNHHIGGPGDNWSNLTPLYYKANSAHLHDVEVHVKRLVASGSTVRYVVKAEGALKPPGISEALKDQKQKGTPEEEKNRYRNLEGVLDEETLVPERLVCSYWEIAKKDGKPGTESKVGIPVYNDPKNYGGTYERISTQPPPKDESNAGGGETE